MPTIYVSDDPSISYTFPPLKPRQQEVIKAYFATRKEEKVTKPVEKTYKVKKGEGFDDIKKKFGVKKHEIKRNKKGKYLLS